MGGRGGGGGGWVYAGQPSPDETVSIMKIPTILLYKSFKNSGGPSKLTCLAIITSGRQL